jgi:hypothetical protein
MVLWLGTKPRRHGAHGASRRWIGPANGEFVSSVPLSALCASVVSLVFQQAQVKRASGVARGRGILRLRLSAPVGPGETNAKETTMPTADEIRALHGSNVAIRLAPQAGGEAVEGRLVGTLDAADGLVVVVEPSDRPGARLTYNYQHIDAIEGR